MTLKHFIQSVRSLLHNNDDNDDNNKYVNYKSVIEITTVIINVIYNDGEGKSR